MNTIWDCQFLTVAKGLGVGRRPPPGIIPATALAGASRDIALDSSGITPGEKQHFRTCSKQTMTNIKTRLADKPPETNYSVTKKKKKKEKKRWNHLCLVCKSWSLTFVVKSMLRISSYEFKSHNTHCGQHCQDFITCTCFLSHEPNVSKHSQLSRGVCSQLSLDV